MRVEGWNVRGERKWVEGWKVRGESGRGGTKSEGGGIKGRICHFCAIMHDTLLITEGLTKDPMKNESTRK